MSVLTAAQKDWPHIHISDSLVMADTAVKMAKEGCKFITVFGVDFMSENVRGILDQAGFQEVGVYRMSNERIGCSLADAASIPCLHELSGGCFCVSSVTASMFQYQYALVHKSLSLIAPLFPSRPSLKAFAQIADLNIWYGPDPYEGTCIVHHLFGHEVVERINDMPREEELMGVVGSTQNILDFINNRVQEALDRNVNERLQFVSGTESGMVTAIVAAVRQLLHSATSPEEEKVSVEIVFPVSSESITRTSNSSQGLNSVTIDDVILPVIPGVASGEGCSIHGGCASCPYVKVCSFLNPVLGILQRCSYSCIQAK
ncbi:hypothetical protein Tsubulata_038478, partial [Turnera subulata]